jgi:hypothetical protein
VVVVVAAAAAAAAATTAIANGKTDYSGLNCSRQFPEYKLLLSFPCMQFWLIMCRS